MREFFRGWKRKLGCVTLVVACWLAGGWIRSQKTFDNLEIPAGRTTYGAVSANQTLYFYRVEDQQVRGDDDDCRALGLLTDSLDNVMVGASDNFSPTTFDDNLWLRYWPYTHFSGGNWFIKPEHDLLVPYWSISLPVIAVSAWLLLSKPRARNHTSIPPASENA